MPLQGARCSIARLFVDAHLQDLPKPLKLRLRDPGIHADPHVRLKLRLHPNQRGQHAHRRQFSGLPIQVVSLEDIAKQMGAQVLADEPALSRGRLFEP
jgi:hypothetical protein